MIIATLTAALGSAILAWAVVIVVVLLVAFAIVSMIMMAGAGDSPDPPKEKGIKSRVPTDPQNKLPIVYGERKQAGTITHADISDDDGTMYFIISICEGPCETTDKILYGDKLLSFDGDIHTGLRNVTKALAASGAGEDDDRYTGNLRMRMYLRGGRCSEMEAKSSSWAVDKEQRTMTNISYVYMELDFDRKKRVSGLDAKTQYFIKGKHIRPITSEDSTTYLAGTKVYSDNPAEALLDFLLDPVYGCSIDIKDIDLDSFLKHRKFCDEILLSKNPSSGDLTYEGVSDSGHSVGVVGHIFGGITTSVIISTAEGMDEGDFNKDDVISPSRTGSPSTTVTRPPVFFSEKFPSKGLRVGNNGIFSVGDAIFKVQAGVTPQPASKYKALPRYTINGMINTETDLDGSIIDLTAASGGWFTYNLGKFGIISDRSSEVKASNYFGLGLRDVGIEAGLKYMIVNPGTDGSFNSFGAEGGAITTAVGSLTGIVYRIKSLGDNITFDDAVTDQAVLRELAGIPATDEGTALANISQRMLEIFVGTAPADALTTLLNSTVGSTGFKAGDVNNDGEISIEDSVQVLGISAGIVTSGVIYDWIHDNILDVMIAGGLTYSQWTTLQYVFKEGDLVTTAIDGSALTGSDGGILFSSVFPSNGDIFVATRSSISTDGEFTGTAQELVTVFSEENIFGGISIGSPGFGTILNKVTLRFPSKEQANQEEDQLILNIPKGADIRNSNEPLLESTQGLIMCNNPVEAERIGSIMLNESRENLTVELKVDISNITLQAGDIIGVRHTTPGWGYEGYNFDLMNPIPVAPKLFRVLYVEEVADDSGSISLSISATEYASETYEDLVIQEKDPTANTNFSNPSKAPDIGDVVLRSKIADYQFTAELSGVAQAINIGILQDDGNTEVVAVTIEAGSTAQQVADKVAAVLNVAVNSSAVEEASSGSGSVSFNTSSISTNSARVKFEGNTNVGNATIVIQASGSTGITVRQARIEQAYDNKAISAIDITRVEGNLARTGLSITWKDTSPFLSRVEIRYRETAGGVFNDLNSASYSLGTAHATSSNDSPFEIIGLDHDKEYQVEIRAVSYLGNKGDWYQTLSQTGLDAFPSNPTNLSVIEEIYDTGTALGFQSKAKVSWDVVTLVANIPTVSTTLSYRLSEIGSCSVGDSLTKTDCDSEFGVWTIESAASAFTFLGEYSGGYVEIENIKTGTYDFKIQSMSATGSVSEESFSNNIVILGLDAPPAVPTNFTLNEVIYFAGSSIGFRSDIEVEWTTGVKGLQNIPQSSVVVQYRLSDAITPPPYIELGSYVEAEKTALRDLLPGVYDFRIFAVGLTNTLSEFINIYGFTVYGLVAVPADPTDFKVEISRFNTLTSEGFRSKAEITWKDGMKGEDNVDVGYTTVSYKLDAESNYTSLGNITPVNSATSKNLVTIPRIDPGRYDFRIQSVSVIGTKTGEFNVIDLNVTDNVAYPSAPIDLMATEELYKTLTGFKSNVILSWTNGVIEPDEHLELSSTSVFYKLSSEDVYTSLGDFAGNRAVLSDLAVDSYDFKIYSKSIAQTVSDDLLRTSFEVEGQIASPPAPVSLFIEDNLYNTNTSAGIRSRAIVTWVNGTEGTNNLPVISTGISYKLTDDDDYIFFGEFSGNKVIINDLSPDTYSFRAISVSSAGTVSNVVETAGVVIRGLEAQPEDPEGLTINASSTQALLNWNPATELDVISGGSVQIRYHPNIGSGVTWATSTVLVEKLAGMTTSTSVNLLIGTYMIKFIDSGKRESINPSVVTNTFAPAKFNLITEVQEAPDFLGSKVNCAVNTAPNPAVLQLSSGQTMMTYYFQSYIDLLSVKTAKISPLFDGEIFNNSNLFCNFDTVEDENNSICTPLADGSIDFLISTTLDDPSDNPTWTPWTSFSTGEYSIRAAKFKVNSSVSGTNITSNFSSLGVTFDTEDKTITGSVTTSTTGDVSVLYPNGGFYTGIVLSSNGEYVAGTVLPRIGVQIIGGNQGDEAIISASTAAGFSISVFNNGSRAARNLDYQSIGQ